MQKTKFTAMRVLDNTSMTLNKITISDKCHLTVENLDLKKGLLVVTDTLPKWEGLNKSVKLGKNPVSHGFFFSGIFLGGNGV